mmetsp:Transcript_52447/g.71601  ORF Transcript_52447/g.71601 Transcript_52447/m.71601 type:complete len:181 (+) Transcript_52447:119-661(+)
MLLRIRLWRPVEKVLEPAQEIAVLRSSTFGQLKKQLGEHHMICANGNKDATTPGEFVSIVKPFAYLLKDIANVPTLKWLPQPDNDAVISSTTTTSLRDGDQMVYKDSREAEDISADVARRLAENKPAHSVAEESGFQIYSPAQQQAREQELVTKAEAQKREDDERTQAILAAAKNAKDPL